MTVCKTTKHNNQRKTHSPRTDLGNLDDYHSSGLFDEKVIKMEYEMDMDLEFYCDMNVDYRSMEPESNAAKMYTLQELLSQLDSF